ncbi:hypothetical protein K438DRAFT_1557258 [Mycena galopus ATCC 62051]|nr:hypothetical protein K438DRAFT_1557258 [Mycena galopus ATCC 62051]
MCHINLNDSDVNTPTVQSDQLKALNPSTVDASLRPGCLEGTRKDVLKNITDWLTTPTPGSNILWLHAVAGAGKSAISTTISEYFRSIHRLGAFLFFDRNNPAGSSPGRVICTIAHSMAMSNSHIREAVCRAIADDLQSKTQVKKLLLEPLTAAEGHIIGPIVVILDALDECGDPGSRERLLSVILPHVNEFPKLPVIFRFLITSRAESDLDSPNITTKSLDIGTSATKHDIMVYLQHSMQTIRKEAGLQMDWPHKGTIKTLADHSGGLFIWASTACKFIQGFQLRNRLQIVLSAGVSDNLDELYTAAIGNSANWTDTAFAEAAHGVLGAVVLSQVPLTDQAIDKLLRFEPGTAAEVLKHLLCVIKWSHGQSALVLHASFSDYLIDEHRSGGHVWFVNPKTLSRSLSLSCMHILQSQLQFNICKLEDSHILNSDVPDLSDRINTHIQTELKYAALFWAYHLLNSSIDDEIISHLKAFMTTQFLHWLEVLSLLNEVPVAAESLEGAENYLGVSAMSLMFFM